MGLCYLAVPALQLCGRVAATKEEVADCAGMLLLWVVRRQGIAERGLSSTGTRLATRL